MNESDFGRLQRTFLHLVARDEARHIATSACALRARNAQKKGPLLAAP
jgi:hypothetical protein